MCYLYISFEKSDFYSSLYHLIGEVFCGSCCSKDALLSVTTTNKAATTKTTTTKKKVCGTCYAKLPRWNSLVKEQFGMDLPYAA